jgi:tetratricopeptide (TPR) repeat protein
MEWMAAWRRARGFALFALAVVAALVTLGPVSPAAGQYLAAAAQARASLRYDRALLFYARASAAAPGDDRPYCLSGEVRMLQREWQSAEAAYQACAANAPGNAAAWLGLGDARTQAGDSVGAEEAWRRAVAAGGRVALRRLALLDEAQGRFADALGEWAGLPANDPQALAHLGLLALERGDVAMARADFIAARAAPNRFADEITDDGFVQIAALAPGGASGAGRLGYTFLAAGMPSFAEAPLRRALELDPRQGAAHAYLGWALWLQGRHDEARVEIARGVSLVPGESFAWFAAGEVAASDGDTAGALAAFRRGLRLDPKNAALWAEAGRMALARRDYVAADLAWETAAQLAADPAYTVSWLRLFTEYRLGFDNGRALDAATRAAQRWPESEPVRFLLAQVYDLLGKPSLAYYTCLQALALDPHDPAPYVLLGRYAENAGNYVTAALELRTALALRPHGPLAPEVERLLAPIAAASG